MVGHQFCNQTMATLDPALQGMSLVSAVDHLDISMKVKNHHLLNTQTTTSYIPEPQEM